MDIVTKKFQKNLNVGYIFFFECVYVSRNQDLVRIDERSL